MRLPAVTIATAFACGIVLGLHPAAVRHASSASLLLGLLFLSTLFVVTGIIVLRNFLRPCGHRWELSPRKRTTRTGIRRANYWNDWRVPTSAF
jgi:hypothetical protein